MLHLYSVKRKSKFELSLLILLFNFLSRIKYKNTYQLCSNSRNNFPRTWRQLKLPFFLFMYPNKTNKCKYWFLLIMFFVKSRHKNVQFTPRSFHRTWPCLVADITWPGMNFQFLVHSWLKIHPIDYIFQPCASLMRV